MQPAGCIGDAPSTTTACPAQPAACIQQRPALAQLNAWTGGNVSDHTNEMVLPTTSAAPAVTASHAGAALVPQPDSEHVYDPAMEAAPADGERDVEQHAADADNSPTLIDVDTTTGSIQLHR